MSNERLYVGNLSWSSDESSINAAFASYGDVREVKVITDRDTGQSRGFAFVTMGNQEQAQEAVKGLNGALLDGRELRVNVAEERPGGGGGGRQRRERGNY